MGHQSFHVGDLVTACGRKDWLPGDNLCRVLSRDGDSYVLQPLRFGMPRTVTGREMALVEAWQGPELTRCDRDMTQMVRAPWINADGILITHGLGETHDHPPTPFRLDHCDSEYRFRLYPRADNERQRDEWMRSDPEVITKTEEGLFAHWQGEQGAGAYFLVATGPSPLISFCIRYWPFAPQGSEAVELTSWHCSTFGPRWRKAKDTAFFDELLSRFHILVSREDLRSGATRFWSYHITYGRDRGHRGGILTPDGTLSYLDSSASASNWKRKHGISSEGALPRMKQRFFIERA